MQLPAQPTLSDPSAAQCPIRCPFQQSDWHSRKVTIEKIGECFEIPSKPGFFQSMITKLYNCWEYTINSVDVIKGYLTGQFNAAPFMIEPGKYKEVCPYASIADNKSITFTDPSIISAILKYPRNGEGPDALFTDGLAGQIISHVAGKHNLMTASSNDHDKIRDVIAPFFEYEFVNNYSDCIEQQAISYAEKWFMDPKPINISSETHRFALEAISKHLLKFERPTEDIQKAIGTLAKLGVKQALFPSSILKYISNLLWKEDEQIRLAERIINDAVKEVYEAEDSLLGHMKQSDLNEEQIIDTVKLLFAAGQETTSSLLTTLIYQLAIHPEWRNKIYEELQEQSDEPLIKRIDNSPSLRRVVYEGLRLHSPAPVISRLAKENIEMGCVETDESLVIPKGSTLNCDNHYSFRDERRWENPEEFNPSRFENNIGHFQPFGSGPGRCLGKFFAALEIKILLAVLIERFDWEAETKHIKETFNFVGGIAADHQQNFFIFLVQCLLRKVPSSDIFIKFTPITKHG